MKTYHKLVLRVVRLADSVYMAFTDSQNTTEDFDWGMLEKFDDGGFTQ